MYINREDALKIFAHNVENDIPFIFSKFGDGELLCMSGAKGGNCDGHPYSLELGECLKKSLYYLTSVDNSYVAYWSGKKFAHIRNRFINSENINNIKYVEYQVLLSTRGRMDEFLRKLYVNLRSASARKSVILVIPERLNDINRVVFNGDACIVNVPILNAYSQYEYVKSRLVEMVDSDTIIITCCGMMAKCLLGEIREIRETVTGIDFGSAFDPLLVGFTRSNQERIDVVADFFSKL